MSQETRICAVIPVYNHAEALPEVVAGAGRHLPVIVVDDGSTDKGAACLPPDVAAAIVRHPINLGKAEALKSGFKKALELGFTHAVTIDADGQHLSEEIPLFIETCRANPDAMLIGVRNFRKAGAPFARRLANGLSNFWFRLASGKWLTDTQCGFRCYPLELTTRLACRSKRYGYELEIMARAAWTETNLIPIPISARYEPRMLQGSHFRPFTDFMLIAGLNARLLAEMFFVPQHLRAMLSTGELRDYPPAKRLKTVMFQVLSDHAETPGRLACSVGLGFFFSVAPIWGFQMLSGIFLAHILRLNKAIVALISNLSIPPIVPLIGYFAYKIGKAMLGSPAWAHEGLNIKVKAATWATVLWFVGSIALGIILGAAGLIVAYIAALAIKRRRKNRHAV